MTASLKAMFAGLLFAVSGAAAAASTLPAAAANEAASLPIGSGAAFRERMLDWSATEPAPHAVPLEIEPAPRSPSAAPARLPRLSSRFGYRGDPLHGAARMHSGIDIPGALGTAIRASADGTVRFAGSAGGYGRMVEIGHGGGLTTRYAHLSEILVRPGATVVRGETIALMGSTGRSTGSHLHFEVRTNGRPADPLGYFGGSGDIAAEPAYRAWRAPSEPHRSRYARARDRQASSGGTLR